MRLTWLRLIALFVVPALAVAGGLGIWLKGGRYASTENAYVKADLVKIAPEVTGTVLKVFVKDHEHVEAGDALLTLDPEPFEIARAQAEAELDAARQHVETLRATLSEAGGSLIEAQNKSSYHKQRAQRHSALAKRGVVSTSKLDEIESDAKTSSDRVMMAQRTVQRALAALGGDPNIPVDEHPRVRARQAALNAAKRALSRTTLIAPVSGTAANVTVQSGEQIRAATPLFAIIADSRPWVEANFKETDLTHVHVGQKATVVLDIYPDKTWQAEVESISPATGAEFAILPPQNASGNWVKVVQRLPIKLRLLKAPGERPLRAGMTASVWIDTNRKRKLADLIGTDLFGKATAKVEQ